MIPENAQDYKLFYIEPHSRYECPLVYFTTGDPRAEWGDDWDDAPWEHNAGHPYMNCVGAKYFLMRIEDGSLCNIKTPDETTELYNSPYSVDSINQGATPWLVVDIWNPEFRSYEVHADLFPAGLSLDKFISRCKNTGIEMWFSIKP